MKALIVSQNSRFLNATTARLQDCGASKITTARTAVETFEAMIKEEEQFHSIILTQDLPDLSGAGLCSVIRTTPGYEITPVMMIAQSFDRKGTDMAFSAGATDCGGLPLGSKEIKEWMKLVAEILQTYQGSRTMRRKTGEHVLAIPFEASNKACIRGISSFVDRFAIDNYIARLPRGTQFRARVFPIRINGFSEIFCNLTFEQFGHLLLGFGDAITTACDFERQLFCYNGNGQFLCVHQDQKEPHPGAIEERIRAEIRRKDFKGTEVASSDLDISVGRIVRANGIFRSSHDIEHARLGGTGQPSKDGLSSRRRIVTRFLST